MPRPKPPEPYVALVLKLPRSLLAAIDAARGDLPRTIWMRAALAKALGSPRTPRGPARLHLSHSTRRARPGPSLARETGIQRQPEDSQ